MVSLRSLPAHIRDKIPESSIPRIKNRELQPALKAAMGGAESEAEFKLINRLTLMGLPKPQLQACIVPGRKFRFDATWPMYKVAAEVQGAVYKARGAKRCPVCKEVPSGRHTRGSGYEADAEKSALAQIDGWMVICVTTQMIENGIAGNLIRDALIARGWRESH